MLGNLRQHVADYGESIQSLFRLSFVNWKTAIACTKHRAVRVPLPTACPNALTPAFLSGSMGYPDMKGGHCNEREERDSGPRKSGRRPS